MARKSQVVARVAPLAEQPRMPEGVVTRPIAGLQPYERNARTHAPAQVAKIAESIREFGWTYPVLVTADGKVVAGHGRLEAAKLLGQTDVPVLVRDDLTPAQQRAYVIADNKLAELAGWDEELLASELQALSGDGFDLGLTGFDGKELDALLGDPEASGDGDAADDDDAAPAAQVTSERGDLWVLGNHRLLCGDSTAAVDVQHLLNGARPHLMVTDPPYGVEYDAAWRQRAGVGSSGAATGKVLNDDNADWRDAWKLFPGSVAYIWHAGTRSGEVAESLKSCRFEIRAQIVWVKQRHVLSRGDYHQQHEPAYYAVRPGDDGGEHWGFVAEHDIATYAVMRGKPGQYRGGRTQSTVWLIEHTKSDTGHSTQKPVECMRRPILNNSRKGEAVYEPFAGSGTTVIAAEGAGRHCYAMELNPVYVDLIVRRWQKFTRREAVLEETGQTFADIEAERRA